MLTVIVRRTEEPKVIQMTQSDLVKQLDPIQGSEILLEDSWTVGLKKVRTPYVCLVEADCTLSGQYFLNNFNLLKKSEFTNPASKGSRRGLAEGGYKKLAILSSALGIKNFANRIYNFHLEETQDIDVNGVTGKSYHVQPQREKLDIYLYAVQIGFIPGAIMRMASIEDVIDKLHWDESDLIKLSTEVCFHLWDTNRRVALNPSTTYVTNQEGYETPPLFTTKVPDNAIHIFQREYL